MRSETSEAEFSYEYYGYWCFYSIILAFWGSFILRISGSRAPGKANAEEIYWMRAYRRLLPSAASIAKKSFCTVTSLSRSMEPTGILLSASLV